MDTLLCLSLSDINFQEILGISKPLENLIEIYIKETSNTNFFNDSIFNKLTAWTLGTYLSDFIILIIDFAQMPDLHHSDLMLKYFNILKDVGKPIFILHKTNESITYEYSFRRIAELIEAAWASDNVLLHEEITENAFQNSQKIEQIKDQMNDNLFDPEDHFDLREMFKNAFEVTIEKTILIQNTRKRELLIKGDVFIDDGVMICKSDLESS